MSEADDNNVISLVRAKAENNDDFAELIAKKPFTAMTDNEQDMYLVQLREKRLAIAKHWEEAKAKKAELASVVARDKIERKIALTEKALERVDAAIEKAEKQIFDLRALRLQYE